MGLPPRQPPSDEFYQIFYAAPVIKGDVGLGVFVTDGKKVAPTP